jgi:hypothetical protein
MPVRLGALAVLFVLAAWQKIEGKMKRRAAAAIIEAFQRFRTMMLLV